MTTKVPVIDLPHVWHVGKFVKKNLIPNSSQEAGQLSVSWCPEAWTQIARLGGHKTWRFEPSTGHSRFLDVLSLSAKKSDALLTWAKDSGLIRLENRWQVLVDDEDGEIGYLYMTTRAAARVEATGTGNTPKRVERFIATEKLLKLVGAPKHMADNAEDFAMIAVAQAAGLDGAWWSEDYAPERYSSPRGCILQSALVRWRRQVESCPPDDEQINEFPTSVLRTITLPTLAVAI